MREERRERGSCPEPLLNLSQNGYGVLWEPTLQYNAKRVRHPPGGNPRGPRGEPWRSLSFLIPVVRKVQPSRLKSTAGTSPQPRACIPAMQHLRFTLQGNSPFLCQESAAERLSIRPRLCVALDSNEYGRPATILDQKKKNSKQCATPPS